MAEVNLSNVAFVFDDCQFRCNVKEPGLRLNSINSISAMIFVGRNKQNKSKTGGEFISPTISLVKPHKVISSSAFN